MTTANEAYAEILGAPYKIWVAPYGTTAPKIDDDEGSFDAAWVQLGTNGLDNQDAGTGVTISIGETIQEYTGAGSTLPIKAFRTDEKATVGFSLVDLTVEMFAKILDDATITTVAAGAGQAGEKSISIVRGTQVQVYALLARGISPYGEEFNAQYEFTRVYQSGSQAPKYMKGTPADLACEFTILGDVNGNDPAIYRAQDAAAI